MFLSTLAALVLLFELSNGDNDDRCINDINITAGTDTTAATLDIFRPYTTHNNASMASMAIINVRIAGVPTKY